MPFYKVNLQECNVSLSYGTFKILLMAKITDENLHLIYVSGSSTDFIQLYPNSIEVLESNINFTWKQLCFPNSISESLKDMETIVSGYKLVKLAEIDKAHISTIKAGLTTSIGLKIDCENEDIAMWYSGLLLYQKAGVTIVSVRDYDNKLHTNISITDFETMHAEQMMYSSQTWTKKWVLQDQITSATTLDQLVNINW